LDKASPELKGAFKDITSALVDHLIKIREFFPEASYFLQGPKVYVTLGKQTEQDFKSEYECNPTLVAGVSHITF